MTERNALFTGRDNTKVVVTNVLKPPVLLYSPGSVLMQTLSLDSKLARVKQLNIIRQNLHFQRSTTCRAIWTLQPRDPKVSHKTDKRLIDIFLCLKVNKQQCYVKKDQPGKIVDNRDLDNSQLHRCSRNEKDLAQLGIQN